MKILHVQYVTIVLDSSLKIQRIQTITNNFLYRLSVLKIKYFVGNLANILKLLIMFTDNIFQ